MTFLEKAKSDLKDEEFSDDGLPCKCPSNYGYEKEYSCSDVECTDCWNREMPNTEPKADGIPVIPQSEVDAWHNAHESGKAEGYEQGLNDAWELVKKIVLKAEKGGLNYNDFKNIFGVGDYVSVLEEFTPQEALEKMKAYEEAQIKVGDIVFCFADCDENWRENKEHYGVLLEIVNDIYTVLMKNGDVSEFSKNSLEKTGKHIDIQSILEQIGE